MMIVRKLPVLMPGTTAVTTVKVKNLPNIVTGNVFTAVCDSVHGGGGLPQCMLGYHPPSRPPKKETPKKEPASRPPPRGKLRGIRFRPTPKGEIEGDQIQAHTQGGN